MTPAALIQKLIEAGTPAELVVEAARLFERYQAQAEAQLKILEIEAERRERDRIRKRNQRLRPRMSRDVPGQASLPLKKSLPRTPSKEITPSLPLLASLVGDAACAAPEKNLPKKGTRLTPDWQPINGDAEFGRKLLPKHWMTEGEKFRDFWIAKPGQQGIKLDWSATWRNWCRRAAEQHGHPAEPSYKPTVLDFDKPKRPPPP